MRLGLSELPDLKNRCFHTDLFLLFFVYWYHRTGKEKTW
jgi:hypothetical protein